MAEVTISEAARILGVSTQDIRRKINRGEFETKTIPVPGGYGMGVVLPDDTPGLVVQPVAAPEVPLAQPAQ